VALSARVLSGLWRCGLAGFFNERKGPLLVAASRPRGGPCWPGGCRGLVCAAAPLPGLRSGRSLSALLVLPVLTARSSDPDRKHTHRAANAAGRAAITSPRPPTWDHGATSVVTNTTCKGGAHGMQAGGEGRVSVSALGAAALLQHKRSGGGWPRGCACPGNGPSDAQTCNSNRPLCAGLHHGSFAAGFPRR